MSLWRTDWQPGENGHRELHNKIGLRFNHALFALDFSGIDPTGRSDSTAGLQAALDAGEGRQVYIPAGMYLVNANTSAGGSLRPRSNSVIIMAPGAELRVIPNSLEYYILWLLEDVENVVIRGGLCVGDRDLHGGTKGEWGYGISIRGGQNISISNLIVRDMWGDGIFIGRGASVPEHIVIENTHAIRNRRQGMSIISARSLFCSYSRFADTSGTAPAAGVDIEPDSTLDVCEHIHFAHCVFEHNVKGLAFYATRNGSTRAWAHSCVFRNNVTAGVIANSGTLHLRACEAVGNGVLYPEYPAYDLRLSPDSTAVDCMEW